jgi:hypothetical protein
LLHIANLPLDSSTSYTFFDCRVRVALGHLYDIYIA